MNHNILKGQICELMVLQKLLELGYTVFKDVDAMSRIDFLVRCEGDIFCKIQVKKSYVDHVGSKCLRLTSWRSNGKLRTYTADDVDFFIAVHNRSFYIIPYSATIGRRRTRYLSIYFKNKWDALPRPYKRLKPEDNKNQMEFTLAA